MSSNYNQYGGYGGNPYGDNSQSNPYGGSAGGAGYGGSNPYGGGYGQTQQPSATQHQPSNYGAQTGASPYSHPPTDGPYDQPPTQYQQQQQQTQYVQPGPSVLSNQDFLKRVDAAKADIVALTRNVQQIGTLHQQSLSSTDSGSSGPLESMVTRTQVLNTSIRDQIKFLEADAARSRGNQVKDTQIKQLKSSFTKQLQDYRKEEADYERRYREQIARQYRIVNPNATDAEVHEAAEADWGNEGVFQTALKSNRSATANTVLGAVRARHNDIQKIERTMLELQQLMEDLATAVVLQDEPIRQVEQQTDNVKHDTEAGNVQLDKGIRSARNTRKLKWWCFWIVLAILAILALVLGLYFGLPNAGYHANNNNSGDDSGSKYVDPCAAESAPQEGSCGAPY